MINGPHHPSNQGGKRRRRRSRRGPGGQSHKGPGSQNSRTGGGIYSAPMDHSYRAAFGPEGSNNNNNRHRGRGGRPSFGSGQYQQIAPEPLPLDENAAPRIFAFVDDLFFLAKIQETARKLNVKVEFVKSDKDVLARLTNGEEKPSLIIFDLNNVNAKPLTVIPKLKSKLKKGTAIIGFLSHLQGELKLKAQEAGCDMVLPRSAFSQNLPQLLRRHGASDEPEGQTPPQIESGM